MTSKRKWLWGVVISISIIAIVLTLLIITPFSFLNNYQKEGKITLHGLKEPVKVLRDEKGMTYIYAQRIHDAVLAQGFMTAQDRLFQMELTRLYSAGRISELVGESGKAVDIRMRTIGIHRIAKKQAKILDVKTRLFFQKYVDGVNAFIKTCPNNHHLEFKLAGIKPELWNIEDLLAIIYFMSWQNSSNLRTEIITQMLVEKSGLEKAREIFPLNINPDESIHNSEETLAVVQNLSELHFNSDRKMMSYLDDGRFHLSSNNWVVGSLLSQSGKPVVANDPHLNARILPGPWYPIGIITPDFRAVGVQIPGIPGIIIGRTDSIAFGITNAYGDTQDLYVETLDPKNPDRYLEEGKSLPFEVIHEKLIIKDKKAPDGYREEKLEIRLTGRGPIISNGFPEFKSKKIVSMRWAPGETMKPSIPFEQLLTARSVEDFRESLSHLSMLSLNFVFADNDGNFGWHVSGMLPIRSQGDGTIPYVVNSSLDNWIGWIPFDEMPHAYNLEKGWVGTCNHKIVRSDYPYYFSSYFSPSHRYRRLKELLGIPGKKSVDDHWQFQRNTMNTMAREIAPLMANALLAHEKTKRMGQLLSGWDHRDDPDKVAPTIFHAVYQKFALNVFQDDLGEELARVMLGNWYFWKERLQKMVLEGTSSWFDDIRTKDVKETRDRLFLQAALEVTEEFRCSLGQSLEKWKWGKVHRIEFVCPIRQKGLGRKLLGGGSHPAPGSVETLCRGIYDFNQPFSVTASASLRMVADLSDEEKVLAVLPGGVSGRMFDPHYKDQIRAFINGQKLYWWFSDKSIKMHSRTTLVLNPQ